MKNKSKNFPVQYSTIPVVQPTVYTLPAWINEKTFPSPVKIVAKI